MTSKEKQSEIIKRYLKPTLKRYEYQTIGQTWWKDKGDFFNIINLQNYSWNTNDNVDFRFNIGIALKAILKDQQKKKATYYDLITHLDEGSFLPDRKNRKFGNNQGYTINIETDLEEFIKALKVDFETYILPRLDEVNTLTDCVKFYERYTFWGDNLKKVIKENFLI